MFHKFSGDFLDRLDFHVAIKNFRALGRQTDHTGYFSKASVPENKSGVRLLIGRPV
jgi:hypothetical protein